eukprot:828681_1
MDNLESQDTEGDVVVVPNQESKPVPVNVVVVSNITGITKFDNTAIIRHEAWSDEKRILLRSFLSQSATFEIPVALPTVSICQVFVLHDIRYSESNGGGFLLQADIQGSDGVALKLKVFQERERLQVNDNEFVLCIAMGRCKASDNGSFAFHGDLVQCFVVTADVECDNPIIEAEKQRLITAARAPRHHFIYLPNIGSIWDFVNHNKDNETDTNYARNIECVIRDVGFGNIIKQNADGTKFVSGGCSISDQGYEEDQSWFFFVKEECALRDLYRCDMPTLETTLQSLGLMNQICNVMRGKRFMVTLQYKPKSPEDIEEQKRVNERTAARRRQRRRRYQRPVKYSNFGYLSIVDMVERN